MWNAHLGETLYLDSNILIFAIEEGSGWTGLLRELFEAIDEGRIAAVTSRLSLAEVLVKPFAAGADGLVSRYTMLFDSEVALRIGPVDRDVLIEAARLRATLDLRLADAIHLATANIAGCDRFVSNDRRLGSKLGARPSWLPLDAPGLRT